MTWVPIGEAAEALSVFPDTVRGRLRSGSLSGLKEESPQRRRLVELPTDAWGEWSRSKGAAGPTAAELQTKVASLGEEDQGLRAQLDLLEAALRHECSGAERMSAVLGQQTTERGEAGRPWWRRVLRRQ